MDEWEIMFHEARKIVRADAPLEEAIRRAVALARRRPELFDYPDYWDRVAQRDFGYSFAMVTRWAQEGLDRLDASAGWESLLLDLGDCPEIFQLTLYGSPFEEPLVPETGNLISSLLIGQEQKELTGHHTDELDDEVLSWRGTDFFGSNGYFFWLVVGSLALTSPLRNMDYCRRILQGRERLYLLSGFEGVFTYLATVTPKGLMYEYDERELPTVAGKQSPQSGPDPQGAFLF